MNKPLLSMTEALALEAYKTGEVTAAEVKENFGVTVASARRRLAEIGVINRQLLNAMLMDSYDEAKDSAQRVAAVRELGKLNGLYAPERQITVSAKTTIEELGQLTDEDLMRIVKGEADILEGEFESVTD